MADKYCYYYYKLNFFFWGEEKMTREWPNLNFFFFKIAFFGNILKKIKTFIFRCMVIPLGPHSLYT